jgi:serine O-acetyltransferase
MFNTLRRDIQAYFDRDPAARSMLEIILCYPGLHAVWFHRISHWLWGKRIFLLARWVSQVGRFFTGIEIHPGATIGPRLVIDHGMAIVIGETAEIGSDVLLYHNVTLGGVDLIKAKRHPTLEDHVVVGAGAQILGPITIGARSRIGANAVVVKDVPTDSVVVGVPGRVRLRNGVKVSEKSDVDLHHNILPDTTMELLQELHRRVAVLEAEAVLSHGSLNGKAHAHDGVLNGQGSNGKIPLSRVFFDDPGAGI